jgi:hypothetical protein
MHPVIVFDLSEVLIRGRAPELRVTLAETLALFAGMVRHGPTP